MPGQTSRTSSAAVPVDRNASGTIAEVWLRNIRVLMPGGLCEGDPFTHAADASACADAAAYRSFEANHASILFHPKFLANRKHRTLSMRNNILIHTKYRALDFGTVRLRNILTC